MGQVLVTFEQAVELLLGCGIVGALLTALIERRARKANERKTLSEADSLDRQSISTAGEALAMANLMRAAAEADLAACRAHARRLEAAMRRHGVELPT